MVPRFILAILFVTAGILHLFMPQFYMKIMPRYLPAHLLLVYASGVCEIFGGLGLLFTFPIRGLAAWGLMALLVAVMPANIYMLTEHGNFPAIPLWALWLRIPMQLPLIWWAWLYTRA